MAARPGERERLTPADASNIVIDAPDQVNAFLMAGVLAPGGPVRVDGGVDLGALRAVLARRIPASPRLSQRVVREGRALVWETATPDLEQHVRLVPLVDGRRGFEALCARLMVTPLPLDRPLWEVLLVPGVASGRVGIVLRIHHAVADGLAAVRLVEDLLRPDVASTATDAAAASVRETPTPQAHRGLQARLKTLTSGWERTVAVFRREVPRTVLLGRIGPRRGVAFVDTPLDALAVGAAAVGATVNDAFLSAVVVAAEATLRVRGEPVPPRLPASVPVALGDHHGSGNAVGVMLVPLPTGEPDPARRLRRISELTRALKADARARGSYELTRSRFGTRIFKRFVRYQRLIVMFVTNVPGPRHPLALAGAAARARLAGLGDPGQRAARDRGPLLQRGARLRRALRCRRRVGRRVRRGARRGARSRGGAHELTPPRYAARSRCSLRCRRSTTMSSTDAAICSTATSTMSSGTRP